MQEKVSNMGLFGGKKDYSGHVDAKEIVKNPAMAESISGKYVLIEDAPHFDKLNMAINIMADAGWKCINFVIFPGSGCILMERTDNN